MSDPRLVPKLIGGDKELGNFILGPNTQMDRSDHAASRRLVREVAGFPVVGRRDDWVTKLPQDAGRYSQDSNRRYLATNGGCIYIDLNHAELATPEVLSARDFVAAWTSMLRIVRKAQIAANARLPEGDRIVVLANNSDRQGSSYGGHQSFLMSREAYDDMLNLRLKPSLFFLMAYQVSSIVFTGQGKVGSENGEAAVDYQISQRADFIETMLGEQTTSRRPLVNTRDEPLCGRASVYGSRRLPGDEYARLHVIFYDTTLAQASTYLSVGVMQLILAMIEAGLADERLALVDPLQTLHRWSHDPELRTRAATESGQALTAVELQLKFCEQAADFVGTGACENAVPEAEKIVALWEDTLDKLRARDFDALSTRLDWVMKKRLLEQAIAQEPGLSWRSPEIVHLDQIFSSLDPEEGLYLQMEAAGLVEAIVGESRIERLVNEPPGDTRAWMRAMLLRAAGPERVIAVDWDHVELKPAAREARTLRVELPDPLRCTRHEAESCFARHRDLVELLEALQASGVIPAPRELLPQAQTYGAFSMYPTRYWNGS